MPATRYRPVIHADGTGRIQIVRANDDPLTYVYLKALGRRIGVEMSVNTSFNVAGPIAQTPQQAIDTLRRSKGLDVVLLVAGDGTVYAAWHGWRARQRPIYGLAFGVEVRSGVTPRRVSFSTRPSISSSALPITSAPAISRN